MTRDDIARMWEKANGWSIESWPKTIDEIERFAKLVAAAEREECAKLLDEMAAADKLSNYYQVAALLVRERGAP
jgi:hypothetical protein